jgi:hypothetical protein
LMVEYGIKGTLLQFVSTHQTTTHTNMFEILI